MNFQELPQVKQEVDIDDVADQDSLVSLESSAVPWSSSLLSPQHQHHLDNIPTFTDSLSSGIHIPSRVSISLYL